MEKAMTSKDVEQELDREPFVPLRLHLVSGKTMRIANPSTAWLMQNALLIFQNAHPGRSRVDGYDVIALRNIERIEQTGTRRAGPKNGQGSSKAR
jgi:hypothetical protein